MHLGRDPTHVVRRPAQQNDPAGLACRRETEGDPQRTAGHEVGRGSERASRTVYDHGRSHDRVARRTELDVRRSAAYDRFGHREAQTHDPGLGVFGNDPGLPVGVDDH